MKAAIIAPTDILHRYCTTGYHLALAHMMDDEKYLRFYQDEVDNGSYVILDNSVIELGHPVDFSWLLVACKRFTPSELVLADFPLDPTRTMEWAAEHSRQFRQAFPKMKLMFVPRWRHEGSVQEFMNNLLEAVRGLDFDTIGIPKFLGSLRPQVCAMLNDMIISGEDKHAMLLDKEYHLLGTWSNPIEILELSKYPWIRGCDSKIPVRLGQLGITLHPHRGLLGEVRYSLPPLKFEYGDDPMPIITNHNCLVVRNWAEGLTPPESRPLDMGKVLPFERR